MEAGWVEETAHQRFWRSLLNTRLDQLLSDKENLRSLRYNWKHFTNLKEKLKLVLEERGLSLEGLVAKAFDETWEAQGSLDPDSEDEQKQAKKSSPVKVKKTPSDHAVSLGPAREVGLRQRESQGHVLQAGDDCREKLVQKRRRCIEARLRRFAQT